MAGKTFTVVVGLYNHLEYLPKLIESLENQMWKDFEVIFCDDGSTDGTKEWLGNKIFTFEHKYFWHKNRGMRLAKSINRGFKAGKGRHFAVIMGDSFIEYNWLMNMAMYRNQNFILCGIRVQVDNGRAVDIDWRLKKGVIPNDDRMLLKDPYNYLTGNGLVFSRKIYEDIGGWDEKIKGYGGDDAEFVARAYYKGYPCWSIASAVLYHHWHKGQESVNNDYVNKKLIEYARV
jgi:glycosyltransferase involved in cell wall biosynthesis